MLAQFLGLAAICIIPGVQCFSLENFAETQPKLHLKSYKLFATNRTVTRNATHLSLPRVFDELVFECNSSIPTRWIFFGAQITDPTVKEIEVNKWRHVNKNGNFTYRSTLKILFNNPNEMINMTCENVCQQNVKGCQGLNVFLELIETQHVLPPYFDMRYAYGNKSSRQQEDEKISAAWLGRNLDCRYALSVDLDTGTYACLDSNNSQKEVPSIFLPCGNPDECDTVFKSENERCNTNVTFKRNCTSGFCSEIRKTTSPFVIACGENNEYSVARSFFKTLDSIQKGDKKIFEYLPQSISSTTLDLVNVTMNVSSAPVGRYGKNDGIIYVGYKREFICTALKSLFSYGFRWILRYKNGTENDLGIGTESVIDATHLYLAKKTIFFHSVSIKSIVCEAPNWHLSNGTESSLDVTVVESTKPSHPERRLINATSSGEIREAEVDVGKSDQNLTCFRSGTPLALIRWSFDGVQPEGVGNLNMTNTKYYTLEDSTEKSEVTLKSGHPFNEVVCRATNAAGTAEVRFRLKRGVDFNLQLVIAVSAAAAFLVVIVVIGAIWACRSKSVDLNLTEKVIEEFQNGNPEAADAFLVPYNMDLEVSSDHFTMSGETLGSGAYGKVVKGRYGVMDVAIKTVKKSADVGYLKALLSELKIMSYVGRHPNIVNLLGACTENIRRREISIILEYCERGDLVSLLRKNRGIFVNYFETKSVDKERLSLVEYQNHSVKKLCTLDLVRWSIEIARGMDFLSSKNVIHGDLAGRNILITQGLNAKVSDFGLAKQLFEYSTYVQKVNVPLPLRWMAYESLKDLQFSVQSDVWSYGVVLWEIFSLGEIPYPGIEWGFASWKDILNGMRNEKPIFASDPLYKIMRECWNLEPNSRPSFRFLWESILDYSNDLRGVFGSYIL